MIVVDAEAIRGDKNGRIVVTALKGQIEIWLLFSVT